jgi:hypothetical protein
VPSGGDGVRVVASPVVDDERAQGDQLLIGVVAPAGVTVSSPAPWEMTTGPTKMVGALVPAVWSRNTWPSAPSPR